MPKQAPGHTLWLKLGSLRSFLRGERWSGLISLLKAGVRAAAQHPKQLLTIVVVAIVGFVLLRELNRDVAFIQPIGIPSFAEELGFSDEVGAYHLRDAILRISDRARRTIYGGHNVDRSAVFGAEVSFLPIGDRLDFEVPVLDLFFQSILALFKEFWGIGELKIAGEFVCSPQLSDWECPSHKELRLRVRVFGFGERVHLIDMGTMGNRGLLGHVQGRHALRSILQHSTIVVLTAVATGDLTSLGALSATLPTLLLQTKYSRAFELEADDYAAALLPRVGISPDRLVTILQRLADESPGDANGALGYVSTHPAPEARVRRLMDRAN